MRPKKNYISFPTIEGNQPLTCWVWAPQGDEICTYCAKGIKHIASFNGGPQTLDIAVCHSCRIEYWKENKQLVTFIPQYLEAIKTLNPIEILETD